MVKTLEGVGPVRDYTRERAEQIPTAEAVPDRLARIVEAVEAPGSAVLLLGEPGSGKTRLAEEAAYALEERLEGGSMIFVLPAPPARAREDDEVFEEQFLDYFGVTAPLDAESRSRCPEASGLSREMLDAIEREAEGRLPVVVAPAVDLYPQRVGALLSALARSRRIRLIATARRLSGAAEQISRDPKVRRLSVGPLTHAEAGAMLTRLLGGEQVEFATLRRWYTITNGHSHSLTVLALALDRRGLVKRDRGMIWETSANSGVPEEFLAHLEDSCTSDELATLEVVALAEPLTESVLIERLSPDHLQSLQSLGLIVPRKREGGETALTTSHELLSASLLDRIPAERKRKISQDLYLTLKHDLDGADPTRRPQRLVRLVTLGLEAGRTLPLEWLTAALDHLSPEPQLELRLRMALAVTAHPDVFPAHLAEAAINASQAARLLGDRAALTEAAGLLRRLAEDETPPAFPASLRIRLRLELVSHLTLDLEQYEEAFKIITDLEREGHDLGSSAAEMVRGARALLFARTGQLRRAELECPVPGELGRMQIEWVRSQSRVVSSLILTQQGKFSEAIRVAEKARVFAVLGDRAERYLADQLTLCVFLAQLAAGSISAASETITRLQEQTVDQLHDTGFIEAGLASLALAEGRWREAAQRATRTWERHTQRDTYGNSTVVSGVLAVAHAALGERAESRRAIVAAEIPRPGIGQTLRGFVRLQTLEARQWNGDPDVAEQAQKVISWAAAERLAYIELRAQQVLAVTQGRVDAALLPRIRELAAQIDDPVGGALLDFFEELRKGNSAWDAPATRMLTEFGMWLPLPRTPLLSAREREIALHAALGYSSRWIAERFFLSTRTVETHLRHVFTKLGVTGRDELRTQFRGGRLSA